MSGNIENSCSFLCQNYSRKNLINFRWKIWSNAWRLLNTKLNNGTNKWPRIIFQVKTPVIKGRKHKAGHLHSFLSFLRGILLKIQSTFRNCSLRWINTEHMRLLMKNWRYCIMSFHFLSRIKKTIVFQKQVRYSFCVHNLHKRPFVGVTTQANIFNGNEGVVCLIVCD